MFREMRRKKQQRTDEECEAVLRQARRGVLALAGEDGYPYAVPMNFYYDEAERCLYFHSAREGHKVDAVRACGKACFTTCDEGWLDEDGWTYHVTSVVAFGRIMLVTDRDTTWEKARALGLKYYPSAEAVDVEMEQAADRVQMMRMEIEHMTGKLVHEK